MQQPLSLLSKPRDRSQGMYFWLSNRCQWIGCERVKMDCGPRRNPVRCDHARESSGVEGRGQPRGDVDGPMTPVAMIEAGSRRISRFGLTSFFNRDNLDESKIEQKTKQYDWEFSRYRLASLQLESVLSEKPRC